MEDIVEKTIVALNMLSAIIGTLTPCRYAWRVWKQHEQANLATWGVILVLDAVGLYLAYATGNHEPYLWIGWCFAAALVLAAAWVRRGNVSWSTTETVVIGICILSVLTWVATSSKAISITGYLTAACVAAIPQAKDYWRDPLTARKSAWMWASSCVAIGLSLAAQLIKDDTDFAHMIILDVLFVANAIMLKLCLLSPLPQNTTIK